MTIHQSSTNEGQGSPNLEYFAYLQDNLGVAVVPRLRRVVKTSVASGTNGIAVNIPTGAKIMDAHVICTGESSNGTMQVKTGADSPDAISNAMICATNDAIVRAGTIDDTFSYVGADGIKVFAGQVGDVGDVYIHYLMEQ